jgi:Fic family protein
MLYVALVDPRKFTSSEFGRPDRRPGDKWAFWYFMPDQLPRELDFSLDTVRALSEADNALGLLQGVGKLVKDPELLVGPYLTREAVASTRIEGTQASLSEVLQAEAGGPGQPVDDDVAEVTNYLKATRLAINLLNELPITERLIK